MHSQSAFCEQMKAKKYFKLSFMLPAALMSDAEKKCDLKQPLEYTAHQEQELLTLQNINTS